MAGKLNRISTSRFHYRQVRRAAQPSITRSMAAIPATQRQICFRRRRFNVPGQLNWQLVRKVKARVYFNNSGSNNDWSPLVAKTFTLEEPMSLRIVEIMYNPPGSGDETEYFELLNTGTEAIQLAGVQITEFSTGGFTFSAGMLNAGERIVVVKDVAAFSAAYHDVTNIAEGMFTGSLANEGELISLRGPLGELLQSFTYGDSNIAGWPSAPDGEGYSLEYIGPLHGGENPLDGVAADPFDDPANWRASLQLNGTPGTGGELNEPDSADFDGDGDIGGRDFLIWQRGFGATGAAKGQGDANRDNMVNGDDLAIWQDQYGMTPPLSAVVDSGEPEIANGFVWIPSPLEITDEDATYSAEENFAELPRDEAFALLGPAATSDKDFGDIAVYRDSASDADTLGDLLFGEVV